MFTNISWGNYILVVLLLLTAWYLFVAMRFYLDELKNFVSGKRKLQSALPVVLSNDIAAGEFNFEAPQYSNKFIEADPTFQDVDNLVARLKSVITDSSQRKLVKTEFTDYLTLVLEEYPTVKNSPFRSSISELIVSECEKIDFLDLNQEEAEALWGEEDK